MELRGSKALLLDQPPGCWQIEAGRVLIFRAQVEEGVPTGRRHFVTECEPGEVLFGSVTGAGGVGSHYLAVAEEQANLRPVEQCSTVAKITWMHRLLGAALGDPTLLPHPEPAAEVSAEPIQKPAEDGMVCPVGVNYLTVDQGEVLLVGLDSLAVRPGDPPLPVPAGAWVVATQPSVFRFIAPTNESQLRQSLARFHQLILQSLQVTEADSPEMEARRSQRRLQREIEETDQAVRYLRGETTELVQTPSSLSEHFAALQAVAREIGVKLATPSPDLLKDQPGDPLEILARASGLRFRHLRLPSTWWQQQSGPFVGRLQDGDQVRPVAVIHQRGGGYEVLDPRSGLRQPLSAEIVNNLTPDGLAIFRGFPRRALNLIDLPIFALSGRMRAIAWVGVLMLIVTILGGFEPIIVRWIIDQAIPDANRSFLLQIALGLAAIHLGQATFLLTQGLLTQRIQSIVSLGLQAAVWDRLLRLPMTFFRQFAGGDLLNRCEILEEACHVMSGTVLRSILSGSLSVLYVVILFVFSPYLTGVALLLGLLSAVMTTTIGYLVSTRTIREAQIEGQVFGFVVQLINGVSKLRGAGAERRAFTRWTWRFSDFLNLRVQIRFLEDLGATINFLTPTVSTLVLYFLAGPLTNPENPSAMSTGVFIAFLTAFGMVLGGLSQLSETLLEIIVVLGRGKLLAPLLKTDPEDAGARMPPGALTGRIVVDRLSFRYRAGTAPVLDEVSFDVRPGEFLAIVGPSGGGKSTLLRLLIGLDRPEAGNVRYDGKDLSQLDLQLLRGQMGVVLQTSYVFQASIYDNIACGKRLSEDQVMQAIHDAGLAEDIATWPMGIHTVVAEGGRNFSGGQRQKLLIARALVSGPRILILDEATSALDNVSQSGIVHALAQKQVTRIVVAHRLSTIQGADRVLVIDQGRVVQSGTFDQLAKEEGLFRRMIERQQV